MSKDFAVCNPTTNIYFNDLHHVTHSLTPRQIVCFFSLSSNVVFLFIITYDAVIVFMNAYPPPHCIDAPFLKL